MTETERLSKSVESRRGKYSWQPNRERHIADDRAQGMKMYNPQLHIEDDWDYIGGFKDYTAAIQEYTKRTLTDQKDMLFAIDGVLETMERITKGFFFGLPQKHFLESLLWYPKLGTLHSYDTRNKIPSWTWASSKFERAGVSFDLMDVRQLRALVKISMRSLSNLEENAEKNGKSNEGKPTALSLVGPYSNLLASLARPLLQKDHTITKIYITEGSEVKRIRCDLPVSALELEDEDEDKLMPRLIKVVKSYAKANKRGWKPSLELIPKGRPILVFETVLVKLRIGRSLFSRSTENDNEIGIFELLNLHDECIGEITTTYGRVRRRRSEEDFITISWGLSLQHAHVHIDYVPRWSFNSKAKGKHQFWKAWNEHSEGALGQVMQADVGFVLITDYIVQKWGSYIPKNLRLEMEGQKKRNTASELLLELNYAEKGKARPRSLWPIVNLILVDWDGSMVRRAGVGRIIMKAWQERWNPPEEIFFA